jgi:hypothetical protein
LCYYNRIPQAGRLIVSRKLLAQNSEAEEPKIQGHAPGKVILLGNSTEEVGRGEGKVKR